MDKIDDISLIRKFVQGKTRLAFNHSLKIEPFSDTVQLLTKKGTLLAVTKLVHHFKIFLVREESVYWELINQVMLENCLMPTVKNEQGLLQYKFTSIPIGHQINYNVTRIMWKSWRSHLVRKTSDGRPLNFLISTPNGWEPVLDMSYSQESVFIKTSIDEKMLHISDKVIWLSPKLQNQVDNLFIEPLTKEENYISASDILLGALDEDTLIEDSLSHSADNSYNSSSTSTTFAPANISNYSLEESTSTAVDTKVEIKKDNPTSELSQPRTSPQNILSIYQGKLYIQTIEGEIVVEGFNMRFWFTPPEGSNMTPQPVEVK